MKLPRSTSKGKAMNTATLPKPLAAKKAYTYSFVKLRLGKYLRCLKKKLRKWRKS